MVQEYPINVVVESKQETESMIDADSRVAIQKIDELNAEAWELRDEDIGLARAHSKVIKGLLGSLKPTYSYERGQAEYLILVAFLSWRQNNFKDALGTGLIAEKLCNEQSLIDLLPKLYGTIGCLYMDLHVQSLGYQYLYRQLFLAEELNQLVEVASAKHDLALNYSIAGKVDVAISMLNEVTNILAEVDDEWFKALTKMNLAICYSETGEFGKAESLLQQGLDFAEDYSHDTARLFAVGMYSDVCSTKKDYQQALIWLRKKVDLSKALDIAVKDDLICEAEILLNLKEYDQVELILNPVLTDECNDINLLVKSYKILGDSYAQQNKYSQATEMFIKYSRCNEKLAKELEQKNVEASELMSDLESLRYEAEQAKINNLLLQEKVTELDKLQEEYYQLSIHDPLTGIPNRRYITEFLTTTFAAARRYQSGFGLALIDIDSFKLVNDKFSHQVGDSVLKQVADILKSYVRQSDAVARFGGEEFIITFKEVSIEDSVAFCERIRKSVEGYNWETIAEGLTVTASFGIASFSTVSDCNSFEDLISFADKKLYESKDKGRNCVSY